MANFILDTDRNFKVSEAFQFPPLNAKETAVLVVDMVNWQVTRADGMLGLMEKDGVTVDYIVDRVNETVVPNLQHLFAVCRENGAKIVYLRVGCFQPDFSDSIGPFRKMMREVGATERSWACEVIQSLRPQPGEVSLLKTGSGGFGTSNLDIHLRNMGIRNVLYTGVITNGCVLLTLAAGFDLGYHGYLVSDATATFSQRWQDLTEEIVGVYMAKVVTTAEIIDELSGAKPGRRALAAAASADHRSTIQTSVRHDDASKMA
jgi:biuret amidohydrolase